MTKKEFINSILQVTKENYTKEYRGRNLKLTKDDVSAVLQALEDVIYENAPIQGIEIPICRGFILTNRVSEPKNYYNIIKKEMQVSKEKLVPKARFTGMFKDLVLGK